MADKPLDRRQFFRRGLGELLKPVVNALDPVQKTLEQLQKLEQKVSPAPRQEDRARSISLEVWLRPPGALPEKNFMDTCSRCGKCVEACPADCIILDSTANKGGGAPYINPDERACVLCDSLACMNVCPSGALLPVSLTDIHMGTAVWNEHICLRSSGASECKICVDICPVGSTAIALRDERIEVSPHACVGCGLCQQHCPTDPKSILVIPKAAREQ